MKDNQKLISLIQLSGLIFILMFAGIILLNNLFLIYNESNALSAYMRENYINQQKTLLKSQVENTISFLIAHKKYQETVTKEQIKDKVYDAYSIAENIYQQNKESKSNLEIQKIIINTLRPIRFSNKKGYYFITKLNGLELLFADKPDVEGTNLLNFQDSNGKFVVEDMIAIAKNSGEGFYSYTWTMPGSKNNNHKKLAYIKYFKPLNFFIGTGLYIDDVENQIKKKIAKKISGIRYGEEGYLFIFDKNIVYVSHIASEYIGKYMGEFKDKNGVLINKELQKVAQNKDGGYVKYVWDKYDKQNKKTTKADKLAYANSFDDWGWTVGTGVYLDSVELETNKLTAKIKEKMLHNILFVCFITLLTIIAFLLLLRYLGNIINNDYNQFQHFLQQATSSNKFIDISKIRLKEFKDFSINANMILQDKIRANKVLKLSEEKYRLLAENISDVIWVYNISMEKFSYISPSIMAQRGINQKEALSGKIEDALTPGFAQTTRIKISQRVLEFQKGHTDFYHDEIQQKCKNKGIIWVEVITKFRYATDKTIEMLGVSRDITKRIHMEQEKEKLQHKLIHTHKLETLGTMSAGIAHDFNNILFAIIGNTELALVNTSKDLPIYKDLQDVISAGNRATEMIQRILTFSRQTTTAKLPIKIQTIVEEALKLLRTSMPSTIEIRKHIDTNCNYILANSTQIHQIVINLATNATHAMKNTAGILEVFLKNIKIEKDMDIQDLSPGDYVKLTVRDTGCGMSDDIVKKIFDPYFTTKKIGEGTGMGLSVVYGIIKDHNGTVSVSSKPNHGTIFDIYFPITKISHSNDKVATEQKSITYGTGEILIIDDENSIVQIFNKLLIRCGYKTTTYTNAKKALEAFKATPNKFDLILTDFTMPQMNGLELSSKIRKINSDIPIILSSGAIEQSLKEKGKEIGISSFLTKPTNISTLSEIIKKALNKGE